MTDIFEHWKTQRFVIPVYFDKHDLTVVLSDIAYWYEHYEELSEWCEQHNCEPVGMTVDVPDSYTLTLFCLRWS